MKKNVESSETKPKRPYHRHKNLITETVVSRNKIYQIGEYFRTYKNFRNKWVVEFKLDNDKFYPAAESFDDFYAAVVYIVGLAKGCALPKLNYFAEMFLSAVKQPSSATYVQPEKVSM